MRYPRCNSIQSRVTNARDRIEGRKRTRICLNCGPKITTLEKAKEDPCGARARQEENILRIKTLAKKMNIKLAED